MYYSYVDLLICWRNDTSHFDTENTLLPPSQTNFSKIIINTDADKYVNTYYLDMGTMMDRFNQEVCTTFRETATLLAPGGNDLVAIFVRPRTLL